MPFDGSSMRWLARPMRCASRLAPFGAPTWIDEVDVAPVDAEVERRGGDDGAQCSRRHRRFDLAPLPAVERAVMQRDRQRVLVDPPELLEEQLRLPARVDEEQRRLVRPDRLVDLRQRVARRMPLPRHPVAPIRGSRSPAWRRRRRRSCRPAGAARPAPAPRARRRDRRARRRWPTARSSVSPGASCRSRARSSDSRSPRLETTSECSSSKITVLQPREEASRIPRRNQQRHLFGRREQDVGRVELLALPLVDRRVAGAGLEPDRQPHLADRLLEIALDVDGERLRAARRRAYAARRSAGRALPGRGGRDRRGSAGSRRASCQRRSARSAAPSVPPRPWRATGADAAAATSPSSQTTRRKPPGEAASRQSFAPAQSWEQS